MHDLTQDLVAHYGSAVDNVNKDGMATTDGEGEV